MGRLISYHDDDGDDDDDDKDGSRWVGSLDERRIRSGSGLHIRSPDRERIRMTSKNLTGTCLSEDTYAIKYSWKSDHFSGYMSQTVKRCFISQYWRILQTVSASGSRGGCGDRLGITGAVDFCAQWLKCKIIGGGTLHLGLGPWQWSCAFP